SADSVEGARGRAPRRERGDRDAARALLPQRGPGSHDELHDRVAPPPRDRARRGSPLLARHRARRRRPRLRRAGRPRARPDHAAEELSVNAAINEGEATAIELLYLWKRGADRSLIQGVPLPDPLSSATAAFDLSPLAAPRGERIGAGMRSIGVGCRRAWAQQ